MITANPLTTGSVTAQDDNSFDTASVAPGANRLALLAVFNLRTGAEGGNSAAPSSITGGGMDNWVQVASGLYSLWRISLWRAMSASPGSGAITIAFPQNQQGIAWSVVEFANVATTGADGADAIAQAVLDTGDGTAMLATLAVFADPGNATYGAFGNQNPSAHTPASGFTQLHSAAFNGRFSTQWRDDPETTVAASNINANNWAAIGVELVVATGADVGGQRRRMMMGVG